MSALPGAADQPKWITRTRAWKELIERQLREESERLAEEQALKKAAYAEHGGVPVSVRAKIIGVREQLQSRQRIERNQLALNIAETPSEYGTTRGGRKPKRNPRMAVYCFHCGARPGERCRTRGGQAVSYVHARRVY